LAGLLAVSIAAGLGMRRRIREDTRTAFAAVLAVFGLCYVILLAPDLRFAIGYLVLLPALFIAHRESKAGPTHRFGAPASIATAALLLATGPAFVVNIVKAQQASLAGLPVSRPSIFSALVIPPKFIWLRGAQAGGEPDPATYVEEINAAMPYRRPAVGDQCWDIPLPCSPARLPSNVALRKPEAGLSGGFVRR
jgi:hypothetical protein